MQIGEQPQMRHYDIANRQRRKFEGQLDLFPVDTWNVSVNAGGGKDEFGDSYFGLQESTFRVAGVAVDFQQPNGFGAGGSYNFERYGGFQVSRSAGSDAEAADPARDWSTDSSENVHYFSLYLTPPRIGRTPKRGLATTTRMRARITSTASLLAARWSRRISFQRPTTPCRNCESSCGTGCRAASRLTVSYFFENFKVYDFAIDPSVVDGIVQPSSLVLGYVYRPYTTHSAVVGLLYFW